MKTLKTNVVKFIKTFFPFFPVNTYVCDKDNSKLCPHKQSITITPAGTVKCSAGSIIACCKGQKILKDIKRLSGEK